MIYHTTHKVCCRTTCGNFKLKFATNHKCHVWWNEVIYLVRRFGRQCYCQVYNGCSKCPPFARTHTQRRLRHPSIASSMMLWSMVCKMSSILQFVNAVQLRLIHSLLDVTPYLVIDRIKVGDIWRPQIWRNESGCWLLKNRTVSRVRCAGALSCWQIKKSPDMSRIRGNSCCAMGMSR